MSVKERGTRTDQARLDEFSWRRVHVVGLFLSPQAACHLPVLNSVVRSRCGLNLVSCTLDRASFLLYVYCIL